MIMTHRTLFSAVLAAATLGFLATAPDFTSKAQAAEYSIQDLAGADSTAFATPEEAVAALKSTLAASDIDALAVLLGLDAAKVKSFEGIGDRLKEIAASAAKQVTVADDGDSRVVQLGAEVWPFPFPVAKTSDGKWAFDTYAGLEEIINRRVGENELQAIATARAYVEAQQDYASEDRDGDGVLEFAQKLVSSEGNTDGLYWPIEQGDGDSPAGPFVDQAALGKAKNNEGYFGYRFRIIHKQGHNIAGGSHDYDINGNMVAGFALIAWPVKYAETGVKTFEVNQQGIVYEKDLGPDTDSIARDTFRFNPDNTWEIVAD